MVNIHYEKHTYWGCSDSRLEMINSPVRWMWVEVTAKRDAAPFRHWSDTVFCADSLCRMVRKDGLSLQRHRAKVSHCWSMVNEQRGLWHAPSHPMTGAVRVLQRDPLQTHSCPLRSDPALVQQRGPLFLPATGNLHLTQLLLLAPLLAAGGLCRDHGYIYPVLFQRAVPKLFEFLPSDCWDIERNLQGSFK